MNRVKILTKEEKEECIRKISYSLWMETGESDAEKNWLLAEKMFNDERVVLKGRRNIRIF